MWGVPAAHSFLLLGRLRGVAGPSVMTRPPVRGHPGPLQTGHFMSKAAMSTQGRASLGTRTPMSLGTNGTVLVSLKNKIQSVHFFQSGGNVLPSHSRRVRPPRLHLELSALLCDPFRRVGGGPALGLHLCFPGDSPRRKHLLTGHESSYVICHSRPD